MLSTLHCLWIFIAFNFFPEHTQSFQALLSNFASGHLIFRGPFPGSPSLVYGEKYQHKSRWKHYLDYTVSSMAAENLSSHRYKNPRLSPGLHLQFSLSFFKSLSQSVSWQELNRGLDLTGSLLMVTKAASKVSGACYKCLVSNLDHSVFAECMAFKDLRSRSK